MPTTRIRAHIGSAALTAVLLVLATGCAGGGTASTPIPTPSYAGAPTTPVTRPTATPSATPTLTETATAEPGETELFVDDVVQYVAVGGAEATAEWHGGCRSTPSIGLSGMSWQASDVALADGRTLTSLAVELSIFNTSGDGTVNVERFLVSGTYANGDAFENGWYPTSRYTDLVGSASGDGVSTYHFEGAPIGTFDLRVYCN